eukprot:1107925-Pleurochrysis_carterae.AAC.1
MTEILRISSQRSRFAVAHTPPPSTLLRPARRWAPRVPTPAAGAVPVGGAVRGSPRATLGAGGSVCDQRTRCAWRAVWSVRDAPPCRARGRAGQRAACPRPPPPPP